MSHTKGYSGTTILVRQLVFNFILIALMGHTFLVDCLSQDPRSQIKQYFTKVHTLDCDVTIKKFPVVHRYIKCWQFAKDSPFIILWFTQKTNTDTLRFI